jgi:NADH dehydrogenase (ubiquinone) 1 beta subcomplex subunit 7
VFAEMMDAKIDIAFRDQCAGLLIPLNKCRRATYYVPFKCEHERHDYEKCQYYEYQRRVNELNAQSS